MYHLFDKVYVDTESRVDRSQDHITIGPRIGYEFFAAPNTVAGEQFGFAQSLDNWTPEEFETIFGKALLDGDKVYVYADGQSYLRIYTMLVKALLPKVDLDTFKWIMLCKKATFNTSLTNIRKPATDVLSTVVINTKVIEELFAFEDPLLGAMETLVQLDEHKLSLEWRILRLKTDGRVGKIPRLLKGLLRRIALANTHDALDVWGRILTDQEHWEFGGCDMETLLNADTVFQGSLNLHYASSQIFLQPDLFKNPPPDEWICGLLQELIELLEHCDEGPTAGRTRLVLKLLQDSDKNVYDPTVCLERVMTMFYGNKRLALPNRDSGKYDENLIRFILGTDKARLQACVQGAQW
jgi:hypothetical protein